MKRSQRLVSRKVKGSGNRRKARVELARVHLKISRQRKDHAIKLARCVITSNDVVVYEDLRIKNMVKNHCLAKSINRPVRKFAAHTVTGVESNLKFTHSSQI